MKNSISLLIIAFLLTSCEKVIELNYKENTSRIIIDGTITNQTGPYFVKITKSIQLTETGTYPTVDNARVTISDNTGNSEILTSQGNGTYRTSKLTGVVGRTYTLTVESDNQTYTAQSTMPQPVAFQSIRVDQIVSMGETEYNLIPVYNDPAGAGNNYRFLLSINDKLVSQHFIQNDQVKDSSVNTDRLEVNDNDYTLQQGDRINITMQCIDGSVALFYKTLALMGDSGPGGGTTPNNPPTNLSNGALGVFSAHTVETKSVTLP